MAARPGVARLGATQLQLGNGQAVFPLLAMAFAVPEEILRQYGSLARASQTGTFDRAADRLGVDPGYGTDDQSPQTDQCLVVRGKTNSPLLQRSIRDAIHGVNKDQVVNEMKTLEQIKVDSVAGERFRTILMGIFASVALLLAAIGLYGVISYSVVQRTREIGIRTALGANPGNIRALVLRSAMTLTALGLLIGMVCALGLAQFLSSMLFNTGKYDPTTLASVASLLALVSILACLIPARRAMRVNPIVALRYE